MNEQTAQGNWQQLSGKIKQKWGKLTDDDLTRAQGDREYLVGKLHEEYGIARDRAEDELETLGYGGSGRDLNETGTKQTSAGYANADNITGTGRGSGLNDQGESSALEQSRESGNANVDRISGSMGSGTGSGVDAVGSQSGSTLNQETGSGSRSRRSQGVTDDNNLSGGEGSLSEDDYSDENIADMQGEGAGHTLEAGGGNAAQTGTTGGNTRSSRASQSGNDRGGAAEQAAGRGQGGAVTDKSAQRRGGQHSRGGRGGNR